MFSEVELTQLFSDFGEVTDARLMIDDSGKHDHANLRNDIHNHANVPNDIHNDANASNI